ncbi:MAG: hypothetical protein LBL13_00595 [Bacteroidales bacterium]|jgi:hypothetical protein|nr:hypothetical protein [Bacteroidales bacterium]
MKNIITLSFLSVVLFALFSLSVFKHISYPLLWQDESNTAMGAERVVQYGYPKVHDGKNIYNDMVMDTTISVNKRDALVGAANWGQYYFGVIGYKLAEQADDLYVKTGLFRTPFAALGMIGLALWVFFMLRFCPGKFSKLLFAALFIFLSLLSVSLTIHLREARYYSLLIFCASLVLGLYAAYRFHKPFNKIVFIGIEVAALFVIFISYSPMYAALLLTLGLSELIIAVPVYRKSGFTKAFKYILPLIMLAAASLLSIWPMIIEFNYFEAMKAVDDGGVQITWDVYKEHIATIFGYFKNYGFLWLAVAMRMLVWCNSKKLKVQRTEVFKVSNFLTLFFIVTMFTVAWSPQMMYTRYFICLLPAMSIVMIFDAFMLRHCYSTRKQKTVNYKVIVPGILFVVLFFSSFINILPQLKAHLYEMTHQYKGPLDYTIPYIKENFPRADTLIIAANYEEYAYMYYLNSKVLIGFAGTNVAEEIKLTPDIIAYRKYWPRFHSVFNSYFQRAPYDPVMFPVFDGLVNNIPELNLMPSLTHKFKTVPTENPQEATFLYIKLGQTPE